MRILENLSKMQLQYEKNYRYHTGREQTRVCGLIYRHFTSVNFKFKNILHTEMQANLSLQVMLNV